MAAKPPTPELAHHPQPNPPTRQLHLPTLRITPEPRSRPHHPRLETRLGQPQPQQPTNTLQTLPHPKNPTRTNNLHTPKTPPTNHTSRRTPILAQTTHPPGHLNPYTQKTTGGLASLWCGGGGLSPWVFVVWWWCVFCVTVFEVCFVVFSMRVCGCLFVFFLFFWVFVVCLFVVFVLLGGCVWVGGGLGVGFGGCVSCAKGRMGWVSGV